ncbi:putative membrane protein [Phytophthora megakarya]|uniref:Putative membrane protein n=1 Tax=Phytophthora megakarya TaxID=4795 RepID=A0A225X5B4_9STRA|nr:putative membrane protein [Phytophthora megakarya]
MEQAEARPVLDRVEQRHRYGLDCGDAIRFEAGSWAPGGEHVHQLKVRNVSRRTIKFKYELPRTKYFSMNFPTIMTLSPGMLTTLEVAFRPVKLEEYDDFVGFHVHVIEGGVAAVSGRFRVPVVARIAALKVEVPHGVDFGFCPTKETTLQRFTLHNCGQIDVLFEWTVPTAGDHGSPFAIQPESGRVKAGARIELTASFHPTSASVYVTTTACAVKPDTDQSFALAQPLVEMMKISEKEFILRNRSLVRASFNIENVQSDNDPRFFFSPLSGVVDAESTVTIRVRYTPLSAGTFTCDHFDILTPGGNCVRITCKGRAIGPMLSIWRKNLESNYVSTKSVSFQDVHVGENAISRVITLRNESPMEIFFHFDAQAKGVFCFDRVTGKIPPFLDLNVTISFSPPHSGNFYRRFFLLVHNQSTRYVDVLGTGYDEKIRPSPFQQAHVDAYRLRAASGIGLLSPDQLETYHEENGDEMFLKGALQRVKDEDTSDTSDVEPSVSPLPPPSRILTRSGEASLAEVEVCCEYFISIEDKGNAVVVQGALLDFGNCGIVQFPSKKVMLVTNHTHSKVTCVWRVAVAPGPSETSGDQSVFQVFPPIGDIAAGATAEFRIAFQPSRVNSYYFAELEAFASFKTNRTFRLVNVDTFTPPWCMVVKACGNTFSSPTDQFLPKISFRLMKNKVQFPPCYLGDSVFQTIMIENSSDTPALFTFVEDPAEVFSCKPTCGYIEAKSFHLVAIRFTPRNVRKYSYFLQCVVNNAREKPEVLELSAICALPQLSFQDIEVGQLLRSEAKVYVKPTSVGLQSLRQIELINTSRVPLVYRWELPSKYQNIFRVKPKLGRLNGRESAFIECTFTPDEIREYASRFLVTVKSISVPLEQRKSLKYKIPTLQELTVRVQTKGTTGAILFQPQTLKFETILVNSNSKQSFFIDNTADCDLTYSLQQSMTAKTRKTRQSDEHGTSNSIGVDTTTPAGKLVFSQPEGCIPAQSRKKITAIFFPTSAGLFTFEVSCVVGNQEASSPYDAWGFHELKQATCIIQGEASFPTIEIQDLRVAGLSTQLAWHQFQCNEINEYLALPLTKEEEKLRRSTTAIGGINDSDTPESDDLSGEFLMKRFALPFSPAPLGSRTEKVFLRLRNPGSLVVQYHLRYPKEGNVEIEHWAETGAPSAEDLRLNAIIDSKVFGISPRQATLLPRQSILLTISYSYTSEAYEGRHNLPLFLEVDKGKKVVLELHGRTLIHQDPKLFLPTQVFRLSPVSIGEFRRGFLPPAALTRHVASSEDNDDQRVPTAHYRMGRPPVQQVEVFNRGESALRLDIESGSFQQINAANYGYNVLVCANNSEIIPAKSSIFLEIEFNPIKAETIEAPLLLKAHGLMGKGYNEIVEIIIVATGYHPMQWTLQQIKDELWASTAPPKKQALSNPDLPVCFVSDYVDFGHVAMYSKTNHLLVLENESNTSVSETCDGAPRRIIFEWDSTHPLVANGTIAFSPKRGELGPEEKVLIRVTVHTGGNAFVMNHDVACMITYIDEHKDVNSNNASTASPTRFRQQTSTSTKPSTGRGSKTTRTSVINQSTATQEAVFDKHCNSTAKLPPLNSKTDVTETSAMVQRGTFSSSRKTLSQSTHKGSPETIGLMSSSDSRHLDALAALEPTPLFVRIYAHVLPSDVMERIYSREELKKLSLPITKQIPHIIPVPASTGRDITTNTKDATTPGRIGRVLTSTTQPNSKRMGSHQQSTNKLGTSTTSVVGDASEAAKCRDVLYDVMETLVMDVLTSSVIQEALEEQLVPLPRSERALESAAISDGAKAIPPSETLYHKVRQNDDCQAIVADVMENTVFNVLQELFYGDLEQELLCVPRKTVFPNATGPAVDSQRPMIKSSLSLLSVDSQRLRTNKKGSQSLLKT